MSASLSRLPLSLADATNMRPSDTLGRNNYAKVTTVLLPSFVQSHNETFPIAMKAHGAQGMLLLCKNSCVPNAAHPIVSCVHSSPCNREAGVTESDKDAINAGRREREGGKRRDRQNTIWLVCMTDAVRADPIPLRLIYGPLVGGDSRLTLDLARQLSEEPHFCLSGERPTLGDYPRHSEILWHAVWRRANAPFGEGPPLPATPLLPWSRCKESVDDRAKRERGERERGGGRAAEGSVAGRAGRLPSKTHQETQQQ